MAALESPLKYIPGLDGLRGIAILMVLLFHFGLLGMGWMGVELFFVLSGFLITKILLAGKQWPLGFYVKRFYWRRSLRIFPLYFAVLLVLTLAYLVTSRPPGAGELFPYLYTYTFNIAMVTADWTQNVLFHYLWSLSFEEQFYLIWPLLLFILPRRGIGWLCLGLVLISPVIRHLSAEYLIEMRGSPDQVGGMIYYLPIGQLDTFATGGLLAVWKLENKVSNPLKLFLPLFGLFLAAGLINALLLGDQLAYYLVTMFGYPISSLHNGQHIWGYTLINLTTAAAIIVAIHPNVQKGGWLRKLLEMRWLVAIGRISYGVYILHWPIIYGMEKWLDLPDFGWARILVIIPFLALVLGLAWLSYHYFESRFLRLKSRKWTTPSATEESTSS